MTTLLDLTNTALPSGKVKVPPRPVVPPREPIMVHGIQITDEAIRTEAQNHPADTPTAAFADAARALVIRELLLHEVRARKIAATPEKLGKGKRETDEDAAIRALLDTEVTSPQADKTACRRYYDANRAKFRFDTLFETRHILFAAPADNSKKRKLARQQAEAIIEQLQENPDDFTKLAGEFSACSSSTQGGNLGQLSKGSTVPEFESVLFTLQEGELSSAPVPTPFGYHVIHLDRIIEGRQLPFDMVSGRIAGWLEASSWSRAVAQYIGILAGKASITGIDLASVDTPLVQ